MKAWVLEDIGNIVYKDVDYPVSSSGYVSIRVEAAGICGSDIPRIYYNGSHKMPIIPGHEFSGVVENIGKDVSPSFLGKHVGVYPLIPCRRCNACRRGMYEMCCDYDYIGSRRDGAFAEYVKVPLCNLIELPESIPFEEAAMIEPMAVAVNAVRKGTDGFTLDKESKIVICGLGSIGLFVVMFLIDAGYSRVYGVGNKPGQKKRLISLGLPEDHYIEYTDRITADDRLSDTVTFFECVGKNETVSCGIDIVGAEGKVVLVGNPDSDMRLVRDTYWRILRNQLTVIGVWNSRFNGTPGDDWHYVIKKLESRRINPAAVITHRLPLQQLNKGLHIMKEKTEDYCKIVISRQSYDWK